MGDADPPEELFTSFRLPEHTFTIHLGLQPPWGKPYTAVLQRRLHSTADLQT